MDFSNYCFGIFCGFSVFKYINIPSPPPLYKIPCGCFTSDGFIFAKHYQIAQNVNEAVDGAVGACANPREILNFQGDLTAARAACDPFNVEYYGPWTPGF